MENDTGLLLGDHVQVLGGFEDGLTGQIVDIDLSGESQSHPLFTIYTDQKYNDGKRLRIGGFPSARLDRFGPEEWVDDTGHWEDGARSCVATMTAPGGEECEIRIRDEGTSPKVLGEGCSWQVLRLTDQSLVDRAVAPNLFAAQQASVRAVVWHGARKEE